MKIHKGMMYMLVSEFVEIELNSSNISYYEELNYEIPRWRRSTRRSKTDLTVRKGTKIIVDIKHLPKGSHVKVDVQCDYCGIILNKPYFKYINQNEKSKIKKDSCNSCKGKKTSEYMELIHNVSHNSQLDSFKKSVSDKNKADLLEVKKAFEDLNYKMLSEYIRYADPIDFICMKHENLGVQKTTYNIVKNYNSGCKACRYEKISGKNYYNWQGGVTNIYNFIRGKLGKWRKDSLENADYKCILTGSEEDLVVHHGYNFYKIVHESLESLKIGVKENLDDYSDNELTDIVAKCLELHYEYGLGIVISKDIHNEYHRLYGNKENSFEEFNEFKKKYINGEFRDVV